MRSKGSRLTGGLEVGHVGSTLLTVGSMAALTTCDQDDVLEVDFLAKRVLLLRFARCVEVAFAFFVAGPVFYFRSMSMLACRFLLASAALCAGAFYNSVAGATFCDVAKVLF